MSRNIEIRDERGQKRFMIDNEIVDVYGSALGPYGLALYMALCRHADKKTQECFPRIKTIMAETGMKYTKAHATLKLLCELGLLKLVSGKEAGERNAYILLKVHADPDEQKRYAAALGYSPDGEGYSCDEEGYSPREDPYSPHEEGYSPGEHTSEQTHITTSPDNLTEGGRGASAPAPDDAQPWGKNHKDHPAVQAYREIARLWPEIAIRPDIIAAVGESEGDVAFWSEVVKAWVATGWSKRNVAGMLDCYGRRELPGTRAGNGRAGPSRSPERSEYAEYQE